MSDAVEKETADSVADQRGHDTQFQRAGRRQPMPHGIGGPDQATLFTRLHQASRAIAAASDAATVGEALMSFAASGGVDVARLLLFADI